MPQKEKKDRKLKTLKATDEREDIIIQEQTRKNKLKHAYFIHSVT